MVRPHAPGPDVYTYWDYYRQRFERNRGMRIDFVLGSPPSPTRVTGALIDRDERAGKGASDHAPVIVDRLIKAQRSLSLLASKEIPAPMNPMTTAAEHPKTSHNR